MAQAFTQNSEQYVAHIDAEIERIQQLRGQVVEVIEGEKQIAAPKKPGAGMSAEGPLGQAEGAAKKVAKAVIPAPAKKAVAK